MFKNIAIIGSSGTIGNSFQQLLSQHYPDAIIHAISSKNLAKNDAYFTYQINYNDEYSINLVAKEVAKNGALDLVIIATGLLHNQYISPEKSLKDLSIDNFQQLFQANTILPALIAKYFAPYLATDRKTIFAALSARVGSISDNKLGGWYAYRASKAALNMIIKNLALELARKNRKNIVLALHPGTVNSALSKPFQNNIKPQQLFDAHYSVKKLIIILQNATPNDSGKCFAWDGQEILP